VAIKGLDEDHFKEILQNNLTPARAISSPQHLKGRTRALRQIDRAFNSPGKHVFIFGVFGMNLTNEPEELDGVVNRFNWGHYAI
jgi:hypothetical protein